MTVKTASPAPMTVQVTPRRPVLLEGYDNTLDVLIQVQAPAEAPTGHQRSPLNLALVLDRSGSMQGQPLAEAIGCARAMIDRLRPDDRAALVVFDNEVDTLVASRPLGDKTPFHQALQTIAAGGSTNLHGGWLQGAQEVAPHVQPHTLSRVLLLSDGQANHGLTDIDPVATQCADLARASVSTSTYGLGRGFNEDLMVAMARAGQGSTYYGETATDLMEPFEREFELLNALCARRLRLGFEVTAGIKAKLLNAYTRDDAGTVLPDLAYGSEAWAVIRLKITAAQLPLIQRAGDPLLTVSVTAVDLDGQPVPVIQAGLTLPCLPAQAFHAVSENALVARRVGELEASDLQEKAQRAAQRGDWSQVRRLLQQVRDHSAENPWLQGIAQTLETLARQEDIERFSKEARYASRNLSVRVAALNEEADDQLDETRETASFLRRKREQGKGNA